MSRSANVAAAPDRRRLWLLVVALAALIVSLVAAWNAAQAYARMPMVRTALLFSTPRQLARYESATAAAMRLAPPETREAFTLFHLARRQLNPALRGEVSAYAAEENIADMSASLRHTRLGDLLALAARLHALEQEQAPADNAWYAVRPVMQRLDGQRLSHGLGPVEHAWSAAIEGLNVGGATASAVAGTTIGQPYGPFLQALTRGLLRVADERERAGDPAGAAACRDLLLRLLREWVLEDGPVGTRLLAADLLIETLKSARHVAEPSRGQLADDLTELRRRYHEAASSRYASALGVRDESALAPRAHGAAAAALARLTWLSSAAAALAVLALAAWPFWLRRGAGTGLGRALAAGAAVALVSAAFAWAWSMTGEAAHELRGDWSGPRYWWRSPFYAAGWALVMAVVGAALSGRRGGATPSPPGGAPPPAPGAAATAPGRRGARSPAIARRLGTSALFAWVLLALLTIASAADARARLQRYELEAGAAARRPLEALLGAEGQEILVRTHSWKPGDDAQEPHRR